MVGWRTWGLTALQYFVCRSSRAFLTKQGKGCAGAGGGTGHRIRIRSIDLFVKPGLLKLEWASEFPGGLVKTQIVQHCPSISDLVGLK